MWPREALDTAADFVLIAVIFREDSHTRRPESPSVPQEPEHSESSIDRLNPMGEFAGMLVTRGNALLHF
jgi:hypothetical protein